MNEGQPTTACVESKSPINSVIDDMGARVDRSIALANEMEDRLNQVLSESPKDKDGAKPQASAVWRNGSEYCAIRWMGPTKR